MEVVTDQILPFWKRKKIVGWGLGSMHQLLHSKMKADEFNLAVSGFKKTKWIERYCIHYIREFSWFTVRSRYDFIFKKIQGQFKKIN